MHDGRRKNLFPAHAAFLKFSAALPEPRLTMSCQNLSLIRKYKLVVDKFKSYTSIHIEYFSRK